MSMEVVEFRSVVKNSLRGFATVKMSNGLIIKDISVLTGRNGPWCSMPAKPVFGTDGKPKIGTNGRPLYTSILEWRDRDLQDKFSAAVIDLILAQYPNAFDGAAP